MKRFLFILLLAASLHAVGTVQTSLQPIGADSQGRPTGYIAGFIWTGDASTGSVPATVATLACCAGYFVVSAEFVPGTPNPTSGYSATITDVAGVDVLGGAAASLSAITPQSFAAAANASPLQGTLTLNISGQSVASAKGTVYVFLNRPGIVNSAKLNAPATAPNWLAVINPPFADARIYNFTPQNPGNTLSSGACSFGLSPFPSGLATGNYLYLSGGVGTAEAVPITGISGNTVSATCANTHSGSWAVQSASGGLQEALQALATVGNGGQVFVPTQITVHAPVLLPKCSTVGCYSIVGRGFDAPVNSTPAIYSSEALILAASDFPTGGNGVIYFQGSAGAVGGGSVYHVSIAFPAPPDSTNIGLYTHWPAALDLSAGPAYGHIDDVVTINAWTSLNAANANIGGYTISNCRFSGYSFGVNASGGAVMDLLTLSNVFHEPVGATTNQITAFLANAQGFSLSGTSVTASNLSCLDNLCVTLGGGEGSISNLICDTDNCILYNGTSGGWQISGGYNSGCSGCYMLKLTGTGGQIQLSNMQYVNGVNTSSIVQIGGANTVELNNLNVASSTDLTNGINITSSGVILNISGLTWQSSATAVGPVVNYSNSITNQLLSLNGVAMSGTSGTGALVVKFGTGITMLGYQVKGVALNGWGTATLPTLSSCGTGPVAAGDFVNRGKVLVGSSATGCTITFPVTISPAPQCTVTSESGINFTYTPSTTALILANGTGNLSSTLVDWTCN